MEERSDRIKKLVGSLSYEERQALASELLACGAYGIATRQITAEVLRGAENWLWSGTRIAGHQKRQRLRMWSIFMLLRHGGLRLNEIMALAPEDLDFQRGMVNISLEPYNRRIPLPLSASLRMRLAWGDGGFFEAGIRPFRCDSSLVRRTLAQCANVCQIKPGLLNARALRRHRGVELELVGVHPRLVDMFLGRGHSWNGLNRMDAWEWLRGIIQKEPSPQTSARNNFYGRIISLEEKGILVETAIETQSGEHIKAIITETSRKRLDLYRGAWVSAIVKAPWIKILPEEQPEKGPNQLPGKIERINSDSHATEILAVTSKGDQICAIYTEKLPGQIKSPDEIMIYFSPFSVILTI